MSGQDSEKGESNHASVQFSGLFSGIEKDTIIVDCKGYEHPEEDRTRKVIFLDKPLKEFSSIRHKIYVRFQLNSDPIYVSALVVSIIFLILTILAYLGTWKKQNIHGWTLLGYVVSLLVQFVLLIIARLVDEIGPTCTTVGKHALYEER
jgi:hypothetical protein